MEETISLYVKASCEAMTDSRLLQTGPDGFTLYMKGLMYSKVHLTDGFIPGLSLAIIGVGVKNVNKTAQSLVALGIWRKCQGGFTVGSDTWAKEQTTKAEVEATREAARQRKQAQRARDRGQVSQCDIGVTPAPVTRAVTPPSETEAKTETETESKATLKRPESLDAVILVGKRYGLGEPACRDFFEKFQAQEWNDSKGRPIKSWRDFLRIWAQQLADPPSVQGHDALPVPDAAAIRRAVSGR